MVDVLAKSRCYGGPALLHNGQKKDGENEKGSIVGGCGSSSGSLL